MYGYVEAVKNKTINLSTLAAVSLYLKVLLALFTEILAERVSAIYEFQ